MRVTVLGGFGVGKTMVLDRVPAVGETVTGGRYVEGPGGKASNQAIQISRLGGEVALISAVGDDPAAALGRELWSREGVDARGVITVGAPTMVGFILVEPGGDNRIALAPGALEAFTPESLESLWDLVDTSDALVVSFELNPEVGFSALRHAKARGVMTVCNPAPAVPIPTEVLECIDYLVPNAIEARDIVRTLGVTSGGLEDSARVLLQHGVGTVIITLGAEGAYARNAQESFYSPAHQVEQVRDTTGAGDSFVGALVVALLKKFPLKEAILRGSAAAAFTVQGLEVVASLPYEKDLIPGGDIR
jgi:ribokinase